MNLGTLCAFDFETSGELPEYALGGSTPSRKLARPTLLLRLSSMANSPWCNLTCRPTTPTPWLGSEFGECHESKIIC